MDDNFLFTLHFRVASKGCLLLCLLTRNWAIWERYLDDWGYCSKKRDKLNNTSLSCSKILPPNVRGLAVPLTVGYVLLLQLYCCHCTEKCEKSDNFASDWDGDFFFLLINFELHVKGRGKLRKFKRGREQKSLGSPDLKYVYAYNKVFKVENSLHNLLIFTWSYQSLWKFRIRNSSCFFCQKLFAKSSFNSWPKKLKSQLWLTWKNRDISAFLWILLLIFHIPNSYLWSSDSLRVSCKQFTE